MTQTQGLRSGWLLDPETMKPFVGTEVGWHAFALAVLDPCAVRALQLRMGGKLRLWGRTCTAKDVLAQALNTLRKAQPPVHAYICIQAMTRALEIYKELVGYTWPDALKQCDRCAHGCCVWAHLDGVLRREPLHSPLMAAFERASRNRASVLPSRC